MDVDIIMAWLNDMQRMKVNSNSRKVELTDLAVIDGNGYEPRIALSIFIGDDYWQLLAVGCGDGKDGRRCTVRYVLVKYNVIPIQFKVINLLLHPASTCICYSKIIDQIIDHSHIVHPFVCQTMSDEAHYLDEYLCEILPKLGLDAETYGPYVTGYANEEDTDDGMDDLIELLRASSETHGDDDASWQAFRDEILRRKKEFSDGEDARKVRSCFC